MAKTKGNGVKMIRSNKAGEAPQPATARRPLGAQGYGLDESQQKLASDLWAWQLESLRSTIVLGGPISG
jgi:hypothetical protein